MTDERPSPEEQARIQTELNGDPVLRKHDIPRPRSILERIDGVMGSQLSVTSAPTQTQRDDLAEAESMFTKAHQGVGTLLNELRELERQMEKAGAPWTPGRLPVWSPN